jgi:hypothetical protein
VDPVHDFWLAAIVLGSIGLSLMAIRHFRSPPRTVVPL